MQSTTRTSVCPPAAERASEKLLRVPSGSALDVLLKGQERVVISAESEPLVVSRHALPPLDHGAGHFQDRLVPPFEPPPRPCEGPYQMTVRGRARLQRLWGCGKGAEFTYQARYLRRKAGPSLSIPAARGVARARFGYEALRGNLAIRSQVGALSSLSSARRLRVKADPQGCCGSRLTRPAGSLGGLQGGPRLR